MAGPTLTIVIICLYMAILFIIALLAENYPAGKRFVNNRFIYSLGLTILYTSWTFFGSVGIAANHGMAFVVYYLGTTVPILFWGTLIRKIIRIKESFHITSIADFISARYNKSAGLAALVTLMSLICATPYIALQLKSIFSTFNILTLPGHESSYSWLGQHSGIIITWLMIGFTIIFGVRRLDPTERHPGMVLAVAVEGIFKLLAVLMVGIFVVYFLHDGFGDIFTKLSSIPESSLLDVKRNHAHTFTSWAAGLLISMFAVMFLPRQFHMMIVENYDENHVRTAVWFLPLYCLLITFFCFPLAMGGLLDGLPAAQGDTFVLRLPMKHGRPWLSILVFLGGFAAASGMIMVCSMTLATMVTNHLIVPIIEMARPLGFLRRHLLACRWLGVVLAIMTGYLFERTMGGSYMLVSMGVVSFAGVSQFAPVIIGGLFWTKGNRVGAYWGLTLGFITWFYTMIIPGLAKSGWISGQFVQHGPLGLAFLKPEQLFGLAAFSPLANAVFWSLFFNVLGYVWGSVQTQVDEEEKGIAAQFVNTLRQEAAPIRSYSKNSTIVFNTKKQKILNLMNQYLTPPKTRELMDQCLETVGIGHTTHISIFEWADLCAEVERKLAGIMGTAAAKQAVLREGLFQPEDTQQLATEYAEILTKLNITPDELQRRVDYYQEREALLNQHAEQLEEKIAERDVEIAERRRIEERLKTAEEKYRSIFENAVDGIFQTTPYGRYLSVNQSLARMLGYDSPRALIDGITDIRNQLYVNPADRDVFFELLKREQSVTGFETRFYRRDGQPIWISMQARMVSGPDGKILYLEGSVQDISDRKRAEAEKTLLEEQLRQAQKMEALGILAGGVSHDFNNLLQAISGFVQLLLMRKPAGHPDRKYLKEIEGATTRAADIVRGLLTFSRKMESKVRVVQLNEVVQDTLKMLQHTLPKTIDLHTELESNLPEIMADPTQLGQVLLNLATNSVDAMPKGGQITIKTEALNMDRPEVSREMKPGLYVRLQFIDDGQGMDAETRQRIFEPFFTTKEVGRGTGLGLAMVYGIVKNHGGYLTCDSEPDEGTTFSIYFPVPTGLAEEHPPVLQKDEVRGGGETILVVDDEPAILEIARELLEEYGYTVITAESGEKALGIYAGKKAEIDLILLDLGMPGLGGERCLSELIQVNPAVKVLVASGYGGHPIAQNPKQFGAISFINKPYALKEMLNTVRRVLDSGSSRNGH